MKVFISWSGKRSEAVAELLNSWIKCVLQAARPWLSTQDIGRGSQWLNEINEQLKDTSVGIICLTQENRESPWVHFEAGALAKGLSANRVCTFLIDLEPSDVKQPLAQLNHTLPQQASVWKLVKSLNDCLGANCLSESVLREVFDTYWSKFDEAFAGIVADVPGVTPKVERPSDDILKEILENSRSVEKRLRRLEDKPDSGIVDRAIGRMRKELAIESPDKTELAIIDAQKIAKTGAGVDQVFELLHCEYGLGRSFSKALAEKIVDEARGRGRE